MNLKQKLIDIRSTLTSPHIEDPDIDAELLLRHATGLSKAQLYLEYERELTGDESDLLDSLIDRRLRGEPITYIVGHKEFFGIDFEVNNSVLIPRPETELLVEKAIELARERKFQLIADIGTGCGAIVVALATHLPECKIYAVDISEDALEVAGANCTRNGVAGRVHLLRGNLLEPLPEPVDMIVANLPYVKDEDWESLPDAIKSHEPGSALAAGKDGLDAISEMLHQAKAKLRPGGGILLEIGYDQGASVLKLASDLFPQAQIKLYTDLAGLDRVIHIETKESDVQAAGA